MEKIVITGGLGYIGTELCKIYSGQTRYKNIIVTDKRFISERVKQLRDWGFTFIQGDILDKTFILNYFISDILLIIYRIFLIFLNKFIYQSYNNCVKFV